MKGGNPRQVLILNPESYFEPYKFASGTDNLRTQRLFSLFPSNTEKPRAVACLWISPNGEKMSTRSDLVTDGAPIGCRAGFHHPTSPFNFLTTPSPPIFLRQPQEYGKKGGNPTCLRPPHSLTNQKAILRDQVPDSSRTKLNPNQKKKVGKSCVELRVHNSLGVPQQKKTSCFIREKKNIHVVRIMHAENSGVGLWCRQKQIRIHGMG